MLMKPRPDIESLGSVAVRACKGLLECFKPAPLSPKQELQKALQADSKHFNKKLEDLKLWLYIPRLHDDTN